MARLILFVLGGAAFGYAHHRVLGRRGGYAITSDPYLSMLYGAVLGFLLSR